MGSEPQKGLPHNFLKCIFTSVKATLWGAASHDQTDQTANQEIGIWLDTVGDDAPLQHSNPASLYLASLQGSEASRTTADR